MIEHYCPTIHPVRDARDTFSILCALQFCLFFGFAQSGLETNSDRQDCARLLSLFERSMSHARSMFRIVRQRNALVSGPMIYLTHRGGWEGVVVVKTSIHRASRQVDGLFPLP